MKNFFVLFIIFGFFSSLTQAQMQRQRAVKDAPIDELFLTGSIAGMSTVTNLKKGDLNSVIMHNFGLVSTGIEEFWGLDQGAAVRLGVDFGISDRLSIGIGRTSIEDNVDVRFKYTILRQLTSDKIPVEIAVKGDLGINTQKNTRFDDFLFQERLNYFGSIMVARKFNKKITLQIAPMLSHFNTVVIETQNVKPINTHFALGIGGRLKLSERKSLTFEFIPVISEKIQDTKNHFALGYEIETGGHVFQMFFMSGKWFTEQHLITRTTTDFFKSDFRLGFNVNRIFGF